MYLDRYISILTKYLISNAFPKVGEYMDNNDFYTFNEYMKKEDNSLTASMEDYLEMIYRLSINTGFTRIHELSDALNVQPPSSTKMVQKMSELGLLKYEKYGVIMLQENGRKIGEGLLKRHKIIEEFFRIIGVPEIEILQETEKMEHTICDKTVIRINDYVNFMKDNTDVFSRFKDYIKSQINNKI
jgi:Mn-dependent DtxR family transcriptional regulator